MKILKKSLWIVLFSLLSFNSQASPIDTDGDNCPDEWETTYGLNPTSALDGTTDLDNDGLSNEEEYFTQHDPTLTDFSLTDEELLELTARKAFLFFWKEAAIPAGWNTPVLIPDQSHFNGGSPSGHFSIGSAGFALAAFVVADDRGWIDHLDAYDRVYQMLSYYRDLQTNGNPLTSKHGYLYHFYDKNTNQRHGDSEISSIDHALFITGALVAAQYYHGTPIEDLASQLYFSTQWNWMWNDDLEAPALPENQRFLRLAWLPALNLSGPVEGGDWVGGTWDRYCELMILINLAVGPGYAPGNYFIPSYTWQHINRHITQYGFWPGTSIPLASHIHSGALFTHQYSHMYLDLKNRPDSLGFDYFQNSLVATLSNRAFTIDLNNADPLKYDTYSENVWGLSAANASERYKVLQPIYPDDPNPSPENIEDNSDSGTVCPFASIGSIPFTPFESISALRHMYENRNSILSGQSIWGRYGFLNSFNRGMALSGASPYFSPMVIGIDLGPIVGMIENYRTGLLWKYTHRFWAVKSGLSNMGFNSGHVEPFLLDFESGSDPNTFGGISGGLGGGTRTYDADTPPSGSPNFSIKITGAQEGDGAWISMNGHSIHPWEGFQFWIKGLSGGESVELGIKDTSAKEHKVLISDYHPSGAVTDTWTLVKIPLDPFISHGIRLTGIDTIFFSFTSSGGTIFVDDIQFIEDAFPPSIPQGFRVQFITPDQARLTWEQNADRDVVGYRIYRRTQGEIDFTEIPTSSNPNHVFVGMTFTNSGLVSSQTYTYHITAVDNYQTPVDPFRGLESETSAEITMIAFDFDNDGIDDLQEADHGTNSSDSDSDDDGLEDGDEIYIYKTDPSDPDSDGDGINDLEEVVSGTNPLDEDSFVSVLFEDDFNEPANPKGWTEISDPSNNISWGISGGTLNLTVSKSGGYAFFAPSSLSSLVSDLPNLAVAYEVTFTGSADRGGFWFRGAHLDVNPSKTGWRDISQKFYGGFSSGTKHHVLVLIRKTEPYYLSDLYIDGKKIFTNEPIQVNSFTNNTIGFVSPYSKGTMKVDRFRLWSHPLGIPFEDSFDESSFGPWLKSGNTSKISWTFQNGALKASPTQPGSGYGFLKPAIVDISGKDLLFEYRVNFGSSSNNVLGGLIYRGVQIDICPARVLIKDSVQQNHPGLSVENWHDIVFIVKDQPTGFDLATLYIDGNPVFEDEPIEVASYADNLVGLVSNYYSGYTLFEDVKIETHLPEKNMPPVILNSGIKEFDAGSPVTFSIQAIDLEGEPLTFNAEDLPPGANIDTHAGEFSWNTQMPDAGVYTMKVKVSDDLAQDEKPIVLIVSQGETKLIDFEEHFETLPAWIETGNIPGIDWAIESGALKGNYIGPVGYSLFTPPSLDISSFNEVAVEFDIRYGGSANKGGLYYRGIQLDINPKQSGWRDNSTKWYGLISSNVWHHGVLIIKGNASVTPITSHLYIDGKPLFTNEPIGSSFLNGTVGFASPYDKGYLLADNFVLKNLEDASGFPLVYYEDFSQGFPSWIGSGSNSNISWTITNGMLSAKVVGSGGYSYRWPYELNIANKDITVQYEVLFKSGANKGGIYYRGVQLDISPSRYGWRDSSQQFFKPGLSSGPHQVKLVIRQANPYPLSDLYIDNQVVFLNQPIQVSSFSNYSIGFTSPYDKGTMLVDNFSVVEN